MKKRTLSILLSLCLAVTLVTPAVAAEPVSTEATEVNNTFRADGRHHRLQLCG